MAKVTFRQPTAEDAHYLAAHMRQEDVHEIMASHGREPLEALQIGLRISALTSLAAEADGTPLVIFGLYQRVAVSGRGVPWLLGVDRSRLYVREFLEYGRQAVSEMLEVTSSLVNYVHHQNRLSIRWLRRLGFTLEPAQPFGLAGELFHRFHQERQQCVIPPEASPPR